MRQEIGKGLKAGSETVLPLCFGSLRNPYFDYLMVPDAGGPFLGDNQGLALDGLDLLAVFSIAGAADPASICFQGVFA